jgi:hypothetical protein
MGHNPESWHQIAHTEVSRPRSRIRHISITPANNGVIVEAGCVTAVFTDIETACAEIVRYYQNPEELSDHYCSLPNL